MVLGSLRGCSWGGEAQGLESWAGGGSERWSTGFPLERKGGLRAQSQRDPVSKTDRAGIRWKQ